MTTLAYWLHILFDSWKPDLKTRRCACWICKVVKWKT